MSEPLAAPRYAGDHLDWVDGVIGHGIAGERRLAAGILPIRGKLLPRVGSAAA